MDMNWLYILLLYNLVVFIIFGIDKLRAVKKHWRISERMLLLLSLLFGATGAVLGMIVFKHKTHKTKFRALVPIFYILNITLIMTGIKYGVISLF